VAVRPTRARIGGALVAVVVLISSCAPAAGVSVEQRSKIADRSSVGQASTPPPAGATEQPAASTLTWGSCDPFGSPSPDVLGTTGWECTKIVVPMDPFNPRPDLPPVTLAVTRHRATGTRHGALVVNPGGPGGEGLEAAWDIRPSMPAELLQAYDVVSWDPRGVGQSVPSINCGPDPDTASADFMATCVRDTGVLAGFLAAPYSAADLEAIRAALGEAKLDYLGYSYGTALGATYAAKYPDRVGHFVLDGAIDPLAGGPDGVFDDGFPYFADDGYQKAFDRFAELCDLSPACPTDGDTVATLDRLRKTVADLPTDSFAGGPEFVDGDTLDQIVASALTYSGSWVLLATALGDARMGDASALAALAAKDEENQSAPSSDPAKSAAPSFEVANLVIYCADFARLIKGQDLCGAMPPNEFTLSPATAVRVERPILVIGTQFDPLTPGHNAAAMAHTLGDAVHVIWEGVGHTAFPGQSACIDRIVTDQLLDGPLPRDGTRCAFVDGVTDDAQIADSLFTHDQGITAQWVTQSLIGRGEDADMARCLGRAIAKTDDRTITHTILGVTSVGEVAALDAARAGC
jgi:pimeloyl-ACP methyl ester carboxylesterase